MSRASTNIDGKENFTAVGVIIHGNDNPLKRRVSVINHLTGDKLTFDFPQLNQHIDDLVAARNLIRKRKDENGETENDLPELRDTNDRDEVPTVQPYAYWEAHSDQEGL